MIKKVDRAKQRNHQSEEARFYKIAAKTPPATPVNATDQRNPGVFEANAPLLLLLLEPVLPEPPLEPDPVPFDDDRGAATDFPLYVSPLAFAATSNGAVPANS